MSMITLNSSQRVWLVPAPLRQWLAAHALQLDQDTSLAPQLLPQLAQAGLLGIGVPEDQGGSGGDVRDVIEAIAQVAEHSMTAAFVYWAQRAFIDYVLLSDQSGVRERWLAPLLSGRLAGAVGLSNVMKFLSRIEPLQVHAALDGAGAAAHWHVQGVLPWVTNLQTEGFVIAVAAQTAEGAPAVILGIESTLAGVQRSADLALMGMRASATAAVQLDAVAVPQAAVLAPQAPGFLKVARPPFLGMQCGMSIGLLRAALAQAECSATGRGVLSARIAQAQAGLQSCVQALFQGLMDQRFVAQVTPLFALRMQLAHWVQEAMQLELMSSGGRAYLQDQLPDFGRRWRESAFIPVVTPSLTQLQTELARFAAAQHADAAQA